MPFSAHVGWVLLLVDEMDECASVVDVDDVEELCGCRRCIDMYRDLF
jgi:hypothetical protein